MTGGAENRQLVIDNLSWTAYDGPATNYPPTANAGPDQLVFVNEPVYLDGSASSDPNNNIESYLWEQISGTAVSLSGATTDQAMFVAPAADADLSFELTVTDSSGAADKDTVNITVREPQDSKLIISEYIEGTSNNKALELYNVADETVNLTGYSVKRASNGGGWSDILPLSGTLAAKAVYVIGNDGAGTAILDASDTLHTVTYFNGNDAIGLFLNDVLVDVIGNPNSDAFFSVAGVSNAAAEHTLIRKPEILEGNTNWASSAGTDADNSEWILMDQDYFGDLGTHSAGPQAYTINNIEVATAFPQAGSEIEVKANVIPGESSPAPSSVKLWYGSGGTQANSVDMFLESGTVYAAAIPSIADGNLRLEYYVQASNGSSSSKSSVRSILVAGTPMSISEIHAGIETLDGQIKTIEGVVTIGAGVLRDDRTSAYLQDNSGRGLNIYSETLYADLERGAHVKMVGEVELYRGTTVELMNFEYTVVSTGNDLPAPVEVSVSGANSAALEGTLAKVTGTLDKIIDESGDKDLILKDGSDTTVVRIWATTGISTDAFETGILYAFTGVGSTFDGKYQLLVGYQEDIDPTVAAGETDTPLNFALHAAYPNPFNPVTTLEYSLDLAVQHTLSVYDLTGRRVSTLYSGYAEPGRYRLSWDAGDFTSGIYFIRLEAARSIATRKVVLIK